MDDQGRKKARGDRAFDGGVGVGFLELVIEVFSGGLVAFRWITPAPISPVEGFVDFALWAGLPEDGFEFVNACFEGGVVKGEVGDDACLEVGF